MSNLGPQWEDDEDYSPARMDAKTIVRDTGTAIVGIATSRQIGAACPTDTSGGLVKDVLYVCNYDSGFERVQFIPVFGKHLHNSSSNQDGGSLLDIHQANYGNMTDFLIRPIAGDFDVTVTGGTAASDSTPKNKIKFDTGATNNNKSNGVATMGIALDFGQTVVVGARLQVSDNANIVTRFGCSTDRIEDTQDTARRQAGIEGCDGHGINWVIINANGTSASLHVQTTTAPLINTIGSGDSFKIVNIPATECRLYLAGVSVGVSTTNVAGDGDTDNTRPFVLGVKTTTTTTRWLKFWIGRLIGAPTASGHNLG
jgi:hypothetical protein